MLVKLMDLRLVCRTWHNILSWNRKLYFNLSMVPAAHLENCGFERISLKLIREDLSHQQLYLSKWEKIGCKLNSLVLDCCKIGDQGLKNIIIHCCNLQSLKVVFNDYRDSCAEVLFCSPDMLRELHITQNNLKTFEIIRNTRITVDVTKWIQIFEVFFKVFPHVTHFISACITYIADEEISRFEFSKELDEGDASGIASSLAFSLSTNQDHYRQALSASSTLRLINVSMRFMKSHFNDEDIITLIEFFTNHRNLKCIKIVMKESISSDILKTLLFNILEHCSNLRKLQYCGNLPLTISKTEFLQLRSMGTHLEELSLHFFKFLITDSSLSSYFSDIYYERGSIPFRMFSPPWEDCLLGFMSTYMNLQHLNIAWHVCSDNTLQKIYEHLITLKTLSIHVSQKNTNLGITGRRGDVADVSDRRTLLILRPPPVDPNSSWISGYSINRLKNLEELTISGYIQSPMNDTIFYELQFLKLRYLSIDAPDDPSILLPIMGQNLPSLEKIHFQSQIDNNDYYPFYPLGRKSKKALPLVSFCQQTKKLRKIILEKDFWDLSFNELWMSKSKIIEVFSACPSLRSIIENRIGFFGRDKESYYDTITQKVVVPADPIS